MAVTALQRRIQVPCWATSCSTAARGFVGLDDGVVQSCLREEGEVHCLGYIKSNITSSLKRFLDSMRKLG